MQTILLCVAGLISAAHARSTFRAGAAQANPSQTGNATTDIPANMAIIKQLVGEAVDQSAEIVVLPEGVNGWMGLIFENNFSRDAMALYAEDVPLDGVKAGWNPCDSAAGDATPQSQQLSCLAKQSGLVVVSNIVTTQKCQPSALDPCPSDGRLLYNTDLAFGSSGELLARYDKTHLSGSYPALDQPTTPVPVTFEALGTKFGLIICQDMSFPTPTDSYVGKDDTVIIFSTNWANSLPLVSAATVQQSYSHNWNVPLIASNHAAGRTNNGGGIWGQGGWPIAVFFEPELGPVNTVIVADLEIPQGSDAQRAAPRPPQAAAAGSAPLTATSTACTISGAPANCSLIPVVPGMSGAAELQSVYSVVTSEAGAARWGGRPQLAGPVVGAGAAAATGSGALRCRFEYEWSQSANASAGPYVFAAMSVDAPDPHSVDSLGFEICTFFECRTFPNCAEDGGQEVATAEMQSFHMAGTQFNDTAIVSPIVLAGNMRVLAPNRWNATNAGEAVWPRPSEPQAVAMESQVFVAAPYSLELFGVRGL